VNPSDPNPDVSPAQVSFATTQWTKVLATQGESETSRQALSELCEHYYAPVHAFIRRRIHDPERAKDLTQDFFAHLLNRSPFEKIQPQQTKFRTYLLGAVKHFLGNEKRKASQAKRGSGKPSLSLSEFEESEATVTSDAGESSDHQFDYQWAINLMARSLDQLEEEFAARNQTLHFTTLKPWLGAPHSELSQKEAGQRLGLSEGAVKVAIHRLRKDFRKRIKQEIAQTLGPNDTVESELKYLVEVIASAH
jgi:RNA polymerase sigma factor (sigma-70 family)